MILWAGLAAVVLSFVLAALATPLTQRLAEQWGMLDLPGRHKTHGRAVPLLGGCAIFAAVLLPSMLALSLAQVWLAEGPPTWLPKELAIHIPGVVAKIPQALIVLAGAMVLHVIGIIDDRKDLGPVLKLAAELAVALGVVMLAKVRILTVAGPTLSVIFSVLWVAAITNAFNFLDNMDGLAAGVAAICAAALLAAAAGMGQLFVSAWLCLLLGALLGFLPYNFHPASSFMGDAGSLVVGYFLAVLSGLIVYVRPSETYYLYGIFIPVVLMAIPIYDMFSVIILRVRERKNPMVGDRRHFSHRLVRRGMSVRTAVLTIYVCTAATAMAASLLPHVADSTGAILVFAQTLAILLILALLEAHGRKL